MGGGDDGSSDGTRDVQVHLIKAATAVKQHEHAVRYGSLGTCNDEAVVVKVANISFQTPKPFSTWPRYFSGPVGPRNVLNGVCWITDGKAADSYFHVMWSVDKQGFENENRLALNKTGFAIAAIWEKAEMLKLQNLLYQNDTEIIITNISPETGPNGMRGFTCTVYSSSLGKRFAFTFDHAVQQMPNLEALDSDISRVVDAHVTYHPHWSLPHLSMHNRNERGTTRTVRFGGIKMVPVADTKSDGKDAELTQIVYDGRNDIVVSFGASICTIGTDRNQTKILKFINLFDKRATVVFSSTVHFARRLSERRFVVVESRSDSRVRAYCIEIVEHKNEENTEGEIPLIGGLKISGVPAADGTVTCRLPEAAADDPVFFSSSPYLMSEMYRKLVHLNSSFMFAVEFQSSSMFASVVPLSHVPDSQDDIVCEQLSDRKFMKPSSKRIILNAKYVDPNRHVVRGHSVGSVSSEDHGLDEDEKSEMESMLRSQEEDEDGFSPAREAHVPGWQPDRSKEASRAANAESLLAASEVPLIPFAPMRKAASGSRIMPMKKKTPAPSVTSYSQPLPGTTSVRSVGYSSDNPIVLDESHPNYSIYATFLARSQKLKTVPKVKPAAPTAVKVKLEPADTFSPPVVSRPLTLSTRKPFPVGPSAFGTSISGSPSGSAVAPAPAPVYSSPSGSIFGFRASKNKRASVSPSKLSSPQVVRPASPERKRRPTSRPGPSAFGSLIYGSPSGSAVAPAPAPSQPIFAFGPSKGKRAPSPRKKRSSRVSIPASPERKVPLALASRKSVKPVRSKAVAPVPSSQSAYFSSAITEMTRVYDSVDDALFENKGDMTCPCCQQISKNQPPPFSEGFMTDRERLQKKTAALQRGSVNIMQFLMFTDGISAFRQNSTSTTGFGRPTLVREYDAKTAFVNVHSEEPDVSYTFDFADRALARFRRICTDSDGTQHAPDSELQFACRGSLPLRNLQASQAAGDQKVNDVVLQGFLRHVRKTDFLVLFSHADAERIARLFRKPETFHVDNSLNLAAVLETSGSEDRKMCNVFGRFAPMSVLVRDSAYDYFKYMSQAYIESMAAMAFSLEGGTAGTPEATANAAAAAIAFSLLKNIDKTMLLSDIDRHSLVSAWSLFHFVGINIEAAVRNQRWFEAPSQETLNAVITYRNPAISMAFLQTLGVSGFKDTARPISMPKQAHKIPVIAFNPSDNEAVFSLDLQRFDIITDSFMLVVMFEKLHRVAFSILSQLAEFA